MKVKVEAVRFVSDRYEWSSIAQRAPEVYHRWEWSEQSRRRVAHLCPHLKIESAYLRVWSDDALVAMPILLIDDIWYNTPRSTPLVLSGEHVDPLAVIDEATEEYGDDVVFIDDSGQLELITGLEWRLNVDADDHRNRQSLIPADLAEMRLRLRFPDDTAADCWFDAIQWVDRSGLKAKFVEYRRNSEPIGWGIYVQHLDDLVCLAAAHVEFEVPTWTSER